MRMTKTLMIATLALAGLTAQAHAQDLAVPSQDEPILGDVKGGSGFETVPVPGDGQSQWLLDSGAIGDDGPGGLPAREDDPNAGYSGLRLRLPTTPAN